MSKNMQGLKILTGYSLKGVHSKQKQKCRDMYIFLIEGTFLIYDRENELCELFDYMKEIIQGMS